VKRIKYLMEKCRTKEEFEAGLFAFRNAPMADGRPAPAVAFHGRVLRDPDLPTIPPAALSPAALSSAAASSSGSSTGSSAPPPAPAKVKKQVRFNAFDEVRIFDPDAKKVERLRHRGAAQSRPQVLLRHEEWRPGGPQEPPPPSPSPSSSKAATVRP
jgi:hypothetical protein